MKRSVSICACLLALGCIAAGGIPVFTAHANSAQSYWRGRDSFGAYVKEENCPVTVEGEKLTLRVPDFPSNYYEREAFESYAANVTAEYTFRNPASYDVDMTLVFPFGKMPDYYYDFYDEEGNRIVVDDTAGYLITADSEPLERTIRYTLDEWESDPEKDIARLSDAKRKSGNFSFDTPVTVYYFRLMPTDQTSKQSYLSANFKGLANGYSTKVMVEGMTGYSAGEEQVKLRGDPYHPFALYVFGTPLSAMPEWKVYEDAFNTKPTDGYVERIPEEKMPTEQTTLGELFMSKYDEAYGASETDWFNAVLDLFPLDEPQIVLKATPYDFDVSERLMRWYEYKLSIPAGRSVVNAVTAPLYPDINAGYTPPVYSYTYLLSPASTWAEFGNFELSIETPYFVTAGSLDFTKTQNGYAFSQQGLPEGELTFTLSASEKPTRRSNFGYSVAFFFTYFWWLLLIPLFILIVAIVLIIVFVRKKKKKAGKS